MSTTFNMTKHKLGAYWEFARASAGGTGAGFQVILLKSAGLEADGVIADHDNLAALLAGANDECDFTNYARKTLFGTSPTTGVMAPSVDDTGNRVLLDLPDLTWASAGTATTGNNTIGGLLVVYKSNLTGADSIAEPCVLHSMSETTNGNDLVARFHADGSVRVA